MAGERGRGSRGQVKSRGQRGAGRGTGGRGRGNAGEATPPPLKNPKRAAVNQELHAASPVVVVRRRKGGEAAPMADLLATGGEQVTVADVTAAEARAIPEAIPLHHRARAFTEVPADRWEAFDVPEMTTLCAAWMSLKPHNLAEEKWSLFVPHRKCFVEFLLENKKDKCMTSRGIVLQVDCYNQEDVYFVSFPLLKTAVGPLREKDPKEFEVVTASVTEFDVSYCNPAALRDAIGKSYREWEVCPGTYV